MQTDFLAALTHISTHKQVRTGLSENQEIVVGALQLKFKVQMFSGSRQRSRGFTTFNTTQQMLKHSQAVTHVQDRKSVV